MTQGTLAERRALVTGGASGIGRATAAALADAGARVLAADRRTPDTPLDGVAFQRTDLRDRADVTQLFDHAQATLGTPDLLVLSAGIGVHQRLDEGDPEQWAEALESNVLGALRVLRAFVPGMLETGGDVVVIGSVAARTAYPWGGVYGATKAALEHVAETLRLETQPRVRVTTVSPGVVDTPFFERTLGSDHGVEDIGFGHLEPAQVADLILYAVSRPHNVALHHVTVRPRAQPL